MAEYTPKKSREDRPVNPPRGGEWDPEDAELGALLFLARGALVSAEVKAETMAGRGRGAVKTAPLRRAQKAVERAKNDLDDAWVATRPRGETGPTPYYPNDDRLPEAARTIREALRELERGERRRASS